MLTSQNGHHHHHQSLLNNNHDENDGDKNDDNDHDDELDSLINNAAAAATSSSFTFCSACSEKFQQVVHFLFGFMLEDEIDETKDDALYRSMMEPSTPLWNALHYWLCLLVFLLSAADAVPISLIHYHLQKKDNKTKSICFVNMAEYLASIFGTEKDK